MEEEAVEEMVEEMEGAVEEAEGREGRRGISS